MAGRAFASIFALLALLAAVAHADITIYTDNVLASPWQDWSWGSTIVYNATDLAEGTSSISVTSSAYAGLSWYNPTPFPTMVGLEFDIAGAQPDISIYFQDQTNNVESATVPLSVLSETITADSFTHIVLNFNNIPPGGSTLGNGSWDRISFQAGGTEVSYHIDNVVLLSEIIIAPEFLSAEPMGNNLIAVTSQGAVNFQDIVVFLNGETVPVTASQTVSPVDTPAQTITYLTLETPLAPGSLSIDTGSSFFNFTIPEQSTVNIDRTVTKTISDRIYGINWPTSAEYIQHLGVTMSRWGGNAVTAYNPFGDFTNAGSDWYFENRAADGGDADTWIAWVSAAGSGTYMTIPALDWVSKDTTSYSYSKTIYPDQESFDPYLSDAGDGLFPNGTTITPPPDPHTAYTNWNTSAAKQWLSNLANKPTLFNIDNEIELASSTHQDMHPAPMGYDEELARMINFSTIAKEVFPDVEIASPSTDSWWYYWTSAVGLSDNAAHNNTDWIPYYLQQMAEVQKTTGTRLVDYLDIHYYFQADTSANDDAAKALRLRLTRSWWDPTYVDESWIGTSAPQSHQPNATIVQLIPRMLALIDENYPGTKLSVSEWDSQADTDVTGGLVVADSLGIFGRYGLDSASYWEDPDETSAAALGFWLFRGYGMLFGDQSVQVHVPNFNPDLLGLYAATSSQDQKLSLVIVNKDPSNPVSFSLPDVPTGTYTIRHFGGLAGVSKWQTTIALDSTSFVVVPAYTAVFLHQS